MENIGNSLSLNSPLEGALFCLNLGFKVFPVQTNRKVPAVTGWQEWALTSNKEKVLTYSDSNNNSNWGIFCGASNIIVVDIDNKNGVEGSFELKALEHNYGTLVETFRVSTPSNGLHYYFSGRSKSSASKIARGIDIKSEGGYVLAPGSLINNRPYQVMHSARLAPIPSWILELNNASQKNPLTRPDDKDVLDSIAEGHRNIELTRWAGVLRGQGLIKNEMLSALLEINENRCLPTLPQEEVERIAHSISLKPRGTAHAMSYFLETKDSNELKEENDWPVSISELKQGQAKPRKWIIKDWLPEGEISSLYGAGSSGKSLLSLQLGYAVSSKSSFLGLDVQESMKVIGLYCEDTLNEVHARLDKIRLYSGDYFKQQNTDFLIWARKGKDNELVTSNKDDLVPGVFMTKLRTYLASLPSNEKKLLILDTLSDIYMGDEIARNKVNKFIKVYLMSLINEFNCSILLLAHPSRAGLATGDLLSGSTAWENAVRNRLGIETKNNTTFLKRLKSNYAKKDAEIQIVWEDGRFVVVGSETEEDKKELRLIAEFLNTCVTLGNDMSVADISTNIITDPKYRVLLKDILSEKRRREKIISLLKREPQFGNHLFRHKYLRNKLTKHWAEALYIGDDSEQDMFK